VLQRDHCLYKKLWGFNKFHPCDLDRRVPASTNRLTETGASARRTALGGKVLLRSVVIMRRYARSGGRVVSAVRSMSGSIMRSIGLCSLCSLRLFLLLYTLGLHVRVMKDVPQGGLDLADKRLGSTTRGWLRSRMSASSSTGASMGTMGGIVDRVVAGMRAGVGSSSGMRAGMVTSGGVVGVVDTVPGQRIVSVVGVVTETSAGSASSAVPGTMLLMSAELTVLSAASDGVSSRRRVGASLVASQRIAGVCNAIASKRVVGVVGVISGAGTATGEVGSGMVARRRVVRVGSAVAGQGIMGVVSVMSVVAKGMAGANVAGGTVTDTVLLISAELAVLGTTGHWVSSRRGIRTGLVTGERVVSVGDTVARKRVVGVVLSTSGSVGVMGNVRHIG